MELGWWPAIPSRPPVFTTRVGVTGLYTFMPGSIHWLLGSELGSSCLRGKSSYPLSHLASLPSHSLFIQRQGFATAQAGLELMALFLCLPNAEMTGQPASVLSVVFGMVFKCMSYHSNCVVGHFGFNVKLTVFKHFLSTLCRLVHLIFTAGLGQMPSSLVPVLRRGRETSTNSLKVLEGMREL